ncbi:DNA-directed RNA polymerase subunit delta [Candidatus Mycoplasma haematominutum]|uniref:RNAP delta factor n=1 Tax=Candidatus Mycoplasma haematominutum 'Birmingham 1' TaxID=1116213 RepID=G8C2U0_9MOLU|nr:DNA-directed RNA polymerase subunit delta [Candidatus Mycoplasma haematominutum]CCE66638.1 DNA-directed RNA polymerase, delta subunit [Candidatus Mycoplasma haematominutum 'Birmingham 1']
MKLNIRELMDIAHEVAIDSFAYQSFNFSSLWSKTWSKAKNFKKEQLEEWIASFYVELLLDPRFVYIGTDKWKLREFMDYNEYLSLVGKRTQDVALRELEIEGSAQTREVEEVSDEELDAQLRGAKVETLEDESYESEEDAEE